MNITQSLVPSVWTISGELQQYCYLTVTYTTSLTCQVGPMVTSWLGIVSTGWSSVAAHEQVWSTAGAGYKNYTAVKMTSNTQRSLT